MYVGDDDAISRILDSRADDLVTSAVIGLPL